MPSGSASRHSVEVRITGGSSRLGGTPLQPHLLPILLAVVLFYQVAGTLGEWVMVGSFPGRTRFPVSVCREWRCSSRRVTRVDKI